MRKSLFVAAVLLAAPLAPAAAQLGIKIGGGATFSSLNEAPAGYTEDSDVGYYVGGSVRFGQFLFVEPGVWYQEQAFKLANGGLEDKIPVRSFLIPVMAGVNFNLQVVSIKLGIGPTATFMSGVGDNDFGFNKDQFNSTRFGYQLGADVRVLFLNLDLNWQQDFTHAFKDEANLGDGKLQSFRVGVGFSI